MAYEFTNKPFKWTKNGQDPTQAEIDLGLQGGMALPADFVNQQWTKSYKAIDETQSVVGTLTNETVRASTADTNGQNQLYKTVDGVTTNVDPVCSLASSADTAAKSETVKYYNATANSNHPLLLSYQAKDTTITDANRYNDVLFSNKFYANPGTGELTAVTFNGNLSGTASEATHATSADSATSANTLKLNIASTTANVNLPILCAPSAYPTTALIQGVHKTEVTYNPSTNTLNVGNISGNAATATKLSGAQTVLYESTTATTSFTLSGLFTDWSAVMIYLTGAWVSGTSGTHGFFVPLKHLKNRGNGGIADFCGNKVINFLYVDDNSMRWFESQSQGAMTYSSVRVVGLY